MQVSMLVTPAAHLSALEKLFAWANEVDLACAWATAREGKADHWKCTDISKIRTAVIGVEFAQTEPWVLRIPCRRISASNKCVTTRATRRRLKQTQFLRSEKSKSSDMVCGYAHHLCMSNQLFSFS